MAAASELLNHYGGVDGTGNCRACTACDSGFRGESVDYRIVIDCQQTLALTSLALSLSYVSASSSASSYYGSNPGGVYVGASEQMRIC